MIRCKLIFSTADGGVRSNFELVPVLPNIRCSVDVSDFVIPDDLEVIRENARNWHGNIGIVSNVTLKKDTIGAYYQVTVLCEDQ